MKLANKIKQALLPCTKELESVLKKPEIQQELRDRFKCNRGKVLAALGGKI